MITDEINTLGLSDTDTTTNTSGCGCGSTSNTCNCVLNGLHGTRSELIDSQTYEIVSDPQTLITSIDNSVSIDDTGSINSIDGKSTQKIYDLSFQCCDEKVKACSTSTEGDFLTNILNGVGRVDISPDCAGNGIDISFDSSGLVNNTYEDCFGVDINDGETLITPQGLLNAIKVSDAFSWYDGPDPVNDNVITNPTGCEEKYLGPSINDKYSKQICQLRLPTDFVEQQAMGDAVFYIFLNGTGTGAFGAATGTIVNTNWTQELQTGSTQINNGGIDIGRDGKYQVGYSGNIEVTWGINGVRVLLFKKAAGVGGAITTILEDRYSGISDNNFENYETTAGGGNGSTDGFSSLERLPFGGTSLVELNEGDTLFFGIKIATSNDNPAYDGRDAEFAVLGMASLGGGASGDVGVNFYAHSIDDVLSLK